MPAVRAPEPDLAEALRLRMGDTVKVTEPGVYDMPAEDYHRDPVEGGSLSSTGARKLLEMAPARWRYEQAHPTTPTAPMILGTAVHSLTLGVGAQVVVIDADDWRTKKAKDAKAEALAAGNVPLLRDDYDQASAMAKAVLDHPVAGKLFSYERGKPEQALVWFDAEFGIWRRSMVDHLPHAGSDWPILVDLKTTASASPRALSKTIAQYGYHQQAAFYLDGYEALFPGSGPDFLFVFVESAPPYLVSVVGLDRHALHVGAELNRRAMEIYRDCTAVDIWPGHSTEIEYVSLPGWASRRIEEPV
ncbi:MAG: PD-(D/E)XK nuclease-like domain-containing protein [Nocardioidaceae bacterium]